MTVIASNVAELVGISYSDPILVDLTPPDILYVYDGRLSGEFTLQLSFDVIVKKIFIGIKPYPSKITLINS